MNDQANPSPTAAKRARKRRLLRWIKRGLYAVVSVVLIVGAVRAFLPKPLAVDVATATRGPMDVTVDEDGKTRVVDRYVISAPLTGNVPRLALREGDLVEEGAVVTRISPTAPPLLDARTRAETEARLAAAIAGQRQATAQVSRAQTALEQARVNAARDRVLAERGALPRVEAEQSGFTETARSAELRSAEFAVKVAAQEAAVARAALGVLERKKGEEPSLELHAPVSGKVLRVLRQDEGVVTAGTSLVELGDPSTLEVVVDVLTRDAVHIEPGNPVRIHGWGGAPLEGRVQRIEPSAFTRLSALGVEEQRVNVVIRFESDRAAWKALGDGFRVEAQIITWRGDDVLTVPSSAVFRRGDAWAVYRVDEGRAILTPIEIGRRNARQVEIVKGLAPSATVIVHPSDRLTDDAKVEARAP